MLDAVENKYKELNSSPSSPVRHGLATYLLSHGVPMEGYIVQA
jgi:hypothetical protein